MRSKITERWESRRTAKFTKWIWQAVVNSSSYCFCLFILCWFVCFLETGEGDLNMYPMLSWNLKSSSQPPECWDYRCVPPWLAVAILLTSKLSHFLLPQMDSPIPYPQPGEGVGMWVKEDGSGPISGENQFTFHREKFPLGVWKPT
jgi:hypothetical protein